MGIDEAAIAAKWINPKIVVPMHYNSFPAIKQNPEEFRMLVEKESADLKVEILKPLDALNYTRNR
jgi:L-ascorbate metabolism protein UlaG (beta-lactamase superfamily)